MLKFKSFLPGLLILLASCQQAPQALLETSQAANEQELGTTKTEQTQPSANSTPAPSPKLATPSSQAVTIATDGIGDAKLGMTIGELKQKLGNQFTLGESKPFMVDLNAIAISQNGEVQYYILHWSGEPVNDGTPIKFLLTENPQFRTTAGVGPGTSVTQAQSAYGKAKLGYNQEVESREVIQFSQSPAKNMQFRSNGHVGEFAGIYSGKSDSSYQETDKFHDNATIASIMLVDYGNN